MARAGLILAATLGLMEGKIRPGVSTAELDRAAERFIRSRGAKPTFKGYRGFPGSICASPNAMIVHGIPGPYKLQRGDVISIDVGVTQCVAGNRLGDVSNAIQHVAERAGLSVVRSLVGHGVGRNMHEDPQVPNFGKPGKGPLLEEGMVLAIEPMTTAGRAAVRVAGDGWAIFSQDSSPAAHFEFTVAITADGPRILTPWHLAPGERTAGPVPQGAAGTG